MYTLRQKIFYITLSTFNLIHNLFPKFVTSTDLEIYTGTYHNAITNPKIVLFQDFITELEALYVSSQFFYLPLIWLIQKWEDLNIKNPPVGFLSIAGWSWKIPFQKLSSYFCWNIKVIIRTTFKVCKYKFNFATVCHFTIVIFCPLIINRWLMALKNSIMKTIQSTVYSKVFQGNASADIY